MSARAKVRPVKPGRVPPELLNLGAPLWRDPVQYHDLCLRSGIEHELEPPRKPGQSYPNRWSRYNWFRRAWAMNAGWTVTTGASGQQSADEGRMMRAGIRYCGSAFRAQCWEEDASPDPDGYVRTHGGAQYGAWEQYPSWAPGMPKAG